MSCRLTLLKKGLLIAPKIITNDLSATTINVVKHENTRLQQISRCFSVSPAKHLKKITKTTEDGVTVVEGVYIDTKDEHKQLDALLGIDNKENLCPLCPKKLKMHIKYTDVLIISQFLRPDGCLLPKRVTGLCNVAQYRLKRLVHEAQRAGLMPEYRPDLSYGRDWSRKKSPYKWRKYNAYFEDIKTY